MKRRICLCLVALFSCLALWAQNRQITGRVVSDSTKQGLPGVNITVKGARTSTATGNDGNYTIAIPAAGSTTLIFSSIGFTTQEVNVGDRSSVDVILETSSGSVLSDVVVVGYATVRRRDLTSAVSSVTSRQLKDVPISSAAEALQGFCVYAQDRPAQGQAAGDD